MTKVLVTGGCGFIGSHLVDELVEYGCEVVVIDNLSSDNKVYFNEKASYHAVDICDYDSIKHLFKDVSCVFHLAAESKIQKSIQNPILTTKTNTLGTATVLQCARESGVKRFVYSSTSAAYGLNENVPQTEDFPEDCLNPYSITKISGEKQCIMYAKLFGMETIILRYFNVYGPREPSTGPYASVVGLFFRQELQHLPLTIVGDGEQSRDFIHVKDVVGINLRAMSLNLKQYGEIYNVGTGWPIKIKDLATSITSNVKYIEPRLGEAKITHASTDKLTRDFDIYPIKIKLDYYIKKFRDNHTMFNSGIIPRIKIYYDYDDETDEFNATYRSGISYKF